MLKKSKNSSRNTAIDRPFDPEILKQAAEIAAQYRIVLVWEDNEYYGNAVEMPYVMADGKTPNQCVKATREILTTAVAYLLEKGQTPPSPTSESKRTEQINLRLTKMEKFRLEEAARSGGFRGVSDYVRSAALNKLNGA